MRGREISFFVLFTSTILVRSGCFTSFRKTHARADFEVGSTSCRDGHIKFRHTEPEWLTPRGRICLGSLSVGCESAVGEDVSLAAVVNVNAGAVLQLRVVLQARIIQKSSLFVSLCDPRDRATI